MHRRCGVLTATQTLWLCAQVVVSGSQCGSTRRVLSSGLSPNNSRYCELNRPGCQKPCSSATDFTLRSPVAGAELSQGPSHLVEPQATQIGRRSHPQHLMERVTQRASRHATTEAQVADTRRIRSLGSFANSSARLTSAAALATAGIGDCSTPPASASRNAPSNSSCMTSLAAKLRRTSSSVRRMTAACSNCSISCVAPLIGRLRYPPLPVDLCFEFRKLVRQGLHKDLVAQAKAHDGKIPSVNAILLRSRSMQELRAGAHLDAVLQRATGGSGHHGQRPDPRRESVRVRAAAGW